MNGKTELTIASDVSVIQANAYVSLSHKRRASVRAGPALEIMVCRRISFARSVISKAVRRRYVRHRAGDHCFVKFAGRDLC
jgi:hypothetical protein